MLGLRCAWVSGLLKPLGIDYCRATQTILVSTFGDMKVHACTTAGACKVFVDHKLPQPRVLQIDLNSSDCSFFLGWRDSGVNRLARFHGDGSLDRQDFATMPAGIANLFSVDFLVPEEGS